MLDFLLIIFSILASVLTLNHFGINILAMVFNFFGSSFFLYVVIAVGAILLVSLAAFFIPFGLVGFIVYQPFSFFKFLLSNPFKKVTKESAKEKNKNPMLKTIFDSIIQAK